MAKIAFKNVDTLSKDLEKRVDEGHAQDEMKHGVVHNHKRFAIIAMDESGKEVGFLQAYTFYAEVYVDNIWVDPAARGRGFGSKLLRELEDQFRGKGFNNMNLCTSGFQAAEFYKKCGFQFEFTRKNLKNPKFSKSFFVKFFDDEVQSQGIMK